MGKKPITEAHEVRGDDIPGLPGYRTRKGRSGLDPIDTYQEAARVEGTLIRDFVTGRYRTRNPLHIGIMILFGLVIMTPIGIYFWDFLTNFERFPKTYIVLSMILLVAFVYGLAWFVGGLRNLLDIVGIDNLEEPARPQKTKEKKKKHPKRRKDYK